MAWTCTGGAGASPAIQPRPPQRRSIMTKTTDSIALRNFLKGLGALGVAAMVPGTATGQQRNNPTNSSATAVKKPDLSFLSPEWQKEFGKLKLDPLDVDALRTMSHAERRKNVVNADLRAIHIIMSHQDWPKVDPKIKERLAKGTLTQTSMLNNRAGLVCGDIIVEREARNNLIFAPLRLTPETLWGYEEWPTRTEDYFTLTPKQLEGVSEAGREWAKSLELVCNDIAHRIHTFPSKVPSKDQIKNGDVNGKAIEVGNVLLVENMEKYGGEFVLSNALSIPPELWEMYKMVGVYPVRQAEVGKDYKNSGYGCHQWPLIIKAVGITGACFVNYGFTPAPLQIGSEIASIQKERKNQARREFTKRLLALQNDKALTTEQRTICRLLHSQSTAALHPRNPISN